MKNALRLSTLLVILSMACAFLSGSSSSSSSSTPKVCLIQNCAWSSTVNTCGKYGKSNLCTRFKNSCAMRYENCVSTTAYTSVSLSQCSGITVGNRGICGGSSSSSSSSSNITPIIIRRG